MVHLPETEKGDSPPVPPFDQWPEAHRRAVFAQADSVVTLAKVSKWFARAVFFMAVLASLIYYVLAAKHEAIISR
jgi:hypothetical protein